MIIENSPLNPVNNTGILNWVPDDFSTEAEKNTKDWIKGKGDYYYTIALQQYELNLKKVLPNYDLMRGKLTPKDFYEPEIRSFVETMADSQLPEYVVNYSILTPPINTLKGEMSKRPDNVFVKAFDADSANEEIQFRSGIMEQLFNSKILEGVKAQLAMKGQELPEDGEYVDQITEQAAAEQLGSYSTVAEKWGSKMLEALKVGMSLKEKSEDTFEDLLKVGQEYLHIYEDKSPRGFNSKREHPVRVWKLMTAGKKYLSDPFNPLEGCYAAGTIELMEISEIINTLPLDKEEIDHLVETAKNQNSLGAAGSTIFDRKGKVNEDSILYPQYDPLVVRERQLAEAVLGGGLQDDGQWFGLGNTNNFGYKFTVLRSYFLSKKKIGELTYLDENGIEQKIPVDENYKKGDMPTEVSVEWGWTNQWYSLLKVGQDVYQLKPFELFDYCPIIGLELDHSLLDAMKNFQTLYNIFANKLFELAQKDKGKVLLTSWRSIPALKDGAYEDVLDAWEMEMKERGFIFVDDSVENTKVPSHFNQYKIEDWSRWQEMQGYYNMMAQIKSECWELVGLSKQRLGAVAATETATGTNTALTQSYAQTEPWFTQHEYMLNKYYQAHLDAAKYIESKKENSTLQYVSSEGERAFLQISGKELLKDLQVFVTSRVEDARAFMEMRQYTQAMLQNGLSPYAAMSIYTTKSIRKLGEILKQDQQRLDGINQQAQQQKQAEMEQSQKQFETAQQVQILQHQKDMENDNMNAELDRQTKREVALIATTAKRDAADDNGDGVPDLLEITKLQQAQDKIRQDGASKQQELAMKQQQILIQNSQKDKELSIREREMQAERERTQATLKIAKQKANQKPKK